jgi:hypothetical protein
MPEDLKAQYLLKKPVLGTFLVPMGRPIRMVCGRDWPAWVLRAWDVGRRGRSEGKHEGPFAR